MSMKTSTDTDEAPGRDQTEAEFDDLAAAATRVNFRLTYGATDKPRLIHSDGISGPQVPNAYYGRGLDDTDRPTEGSGDWEDPHHMVASQDEHIEHWFASAVSESVHEALEWFWVDNQIYLNPHGKNENAIHALSEQFARDLLALRKPADTTEHNA